MILAIVALGIYVVGRFDKPLPLRRGPRLWILSGAAAEAACIVCLFFCRPVGEKLLWAVIGGCLLFACVTDRLLCQVYNFTWWIFLAAVPALFWRRADVLAEDGLLSFEALGGLLLFIGLQLLLQAHIYGRADAYAFCSCALAEAAFGLSAAGFLVHMLIAYALLFAVQLCRRNMDRRGNLRKPVPFLPYITAAFWMALALYSLR